MSTRTRSNCHIIISCIISFHLLVTSVIKNEKKISFGGLVDWLSYIRYSRWCFGVLVDWLSYIILLYYCLWILSVTWVKENFKGWHVAFYFFNALFVSKNIDFWKNPKSSKIRKNKTLFPTKAHWFPVIFKDNLETLSLADSVFAIFYEVTSRSPWIPLPRREAPGTDL